MGKQVSDTCYNSTRYPNHDPSNMVSKSKADYNDRKWKGEDEIQEPPYRLQPRWCIGSETFETHTQKEVQQPMKENDATNCHVEENNIPIIFVVFLFCFLAPGKVKRDNDSCHEAIFDKCDHVGIDIGSAAGIW